MFVVIKRKRLAIVLTAVIAVQVMLTAFLIIRQVQNNGVSLIDFTVVIDAGHGGIDGGVTCNGIRESDLNLQYAKTLGKLFENGGFNVVYTRTTDKGLYGLPTKGFKQRDMKSRKKIIDEAKPNLVISIHMNKFSISARSGPQVFYQQGNSQGKLLADSLQSVLNEFSDNNHTSIFGDFYVCREVSCPSVIVECGFLSNDNDAKLLQTEDYRNALCSQLFNGVMLYLYSA